MVFQENTPQTWGSFSNGNGYLQTGYVLFPSYYGSASTYALPSVDPPPEGSRRAWKLAECCCPPPVPVERASLPLVALRPRHACRRLLLLPRLYSGARERRAVRRVVERKDARARRGSRLPRWR